jgi:hypothetical protein
MYFLPWNHSNPTSDTTWIGYKNLYCYNLFIYWSAFSLNLSGWFRNWPTRRDEKVLAWIGYGKIVQREVCNETLVHFILNWKIQVHILRWHKSLVHEKNNPSTIEVMNLSVYITRIALFTRNVDPLQFRWVDDSCKRP